MFVLPVVTPPPHTPPVTPPPSPCLSQEHKDADVRLPGLVALTPRQLYYVDFAQTWCSHNSVSSLFCQLKTDLHSPNKYRVLGAVRNEPHFGQVFNCPLGSPMNPRHKCRLW